jgi:hypothetical protein
MHSTLDIFTTIGAEIPKEQLEEVAGGRIHDVIISGPCFPLPFEYDVFFQ